MLGYDLEKPEEALALAEDAKAAIERVGSPPSLQYILESRLGRTYSGTAQYQKMFEHHSKSLELRRKVFGEDDPNTASGYNNVGVALYSLARFPDALAMHRKAQVIREKVLGFDHPDTAMSYGNVGNQYYQVGKLEEALQSTDAALAIAKRSLPPKHGTNVIALTKASVLAELERFDESEAAFNEVFAILNKDYQKTGRMARTLADRAGLLFARTGRGKQALADAEQAIALMVSITGKDNDDYGVTADAKAKALHGLKRYDEALASYAEAIAVYEKVLGPDDPLLNDPLLGIAQIHIARGKHAKAVA